MMDSVGHYSRLELLQLAIRRERQPQVRELSASLDQEDSTISLEPRSQNGAFATSLEGFTSEPTAS